MEFDRKCLFLEELLHLMKVCFAWAIGCLSP